MEELGGPLGVEEAGASATSGRASSTSFNRGRRANVQSLQSTSPRTIEGITTISAEDFVHSSAVQPLTPLPGDAADAAPRAPVWVLKQAQRDISHQMDGASSSGDLYEQRVHALRTEIEAERRECAALEDRLLAMERWAGIAPSTADRE
jgi:hypothetical protein